MTDALCFPGKCQQRRGPSRGLPQLFAIPHAAVITSGSQVGNIWRPYGVGVKQWVSGVSTRLFLQETSMYEHLHCWQLWGALPESGGLRKVWGAVGGRNSLSWAPAPGGLTPCMCPKCFLVSRGRTSLVLEMPPPWRSI